MAGPAGGSPARQPTDQKAVPKRRGSHHIPGLEFFLFLTEHNDLIYNVVRGIPL